MADEPPGEHVPPEVAAEEAPEEHGDAMEGEAPDEH